MRPPEREQGGRVVAGAREPRCSAQDDLPDDLACGCAKEVRAGGAKQRFPCKGSFVLPNDESETEHAESRERDGGGGEQDDVAGAAASLFDENSARDRRHRQREHDEAPGLQALRALRGAHRHAPHRSMQCGRGDEPVGKYPTHVDGLSIPVRLVKIEPAVDGVGHEQRKQARPEEGQGRRHFPVREEQANRDGEQQDVGEGVRGRDRDSRGRQSVVAEIRPDEDDPRDRAEGDGDEGGVDQARPVLSRPPAADEENEPAGQNGIPRQVEHVCRRRKRVRADDPVVHAKGDVTDDEQGLTGEHEEPGRTVRRAVPPDSVRDRDDGRHAEQVERAVGLPPGVRGEQVRDADGRREREVPAGCPTRHASQAIDVRGRSQVRESTVLELRRIPRIDARPRMGDTGPPPGSDNPTSRMARILVVDDNHETQRLLYLYLGAQGYELVSAMDGVAAISQGLRHRPDVILLDIGLPAGDGYAVLERFAAIPALAAKPVIVISAHERERVEPRLAGRGVVGYFQKPLALTELLRAVAELVVAAPGSADGVLLH